jgi:(p)ppGpp synthase/HD superfamily hydrolase
MIYTDLTNKALCYAYNAHHGQLDYNGIPFIFHPLHLAEAMDDEISCCAALLHDIVEDTDLTLDDLREEFPEEVVEVVALLTHGDSAEHNHEDYFAYIRTIRNHPVAKKIKLADIAHNADQTRLDGDDPRAEYWEKKYTAARTFLEA